MVLTLSSPAIGHRLAARASVHVAAVRPAPAGLRRPCRRARSVRVAALLDPHAAMTAASSVHSIFQFADVDAAGAVVAAAGDAPAVVERTGFMNGIANGLESLLEVIDGGLQAGGVPYSYGFSIILLTFLVKLVTFPLTKKQIDSTTAMQQIAPRVKELQVGPSFLKLHLFEVASTQLSNRPRQARYANDTERLQMETARLYKEANVNPLAGCLPTLATLPVRTMDAAPDASALHFRLLGAQQFCP